MPRPNILIIYPDQLRADALGCYGNPLVPTPNIDRLASEGVLAENAFVSFPLCAPFRASFFTGKYAHKAGVSANHYPIPLDQEFLAERLRRAGHATAYFGKWHLDGGRKFSYVPPGPRRLGFEHFVGFNRGHDYFKSIFYRDDGLPRTSRRYEPDYQSDHVIEFMESVAREARAPFLAMVNYGIPHPPLVAPPEYMGRFHPEDVRLSPAVPADPEAQAAARDFMARYYALVANLDDNVGRLLDWLDARRLAEDTLVLLVSDHGEMGGEHGLYAKKTYFRSAMRVPLLARYSSRFPAGRRLAGLIDPGVDTFPTLLELCGLPLPERVQGRSYLGLLDGREENSRGHVYYQILKETQGEEAFPVPERGLRTLEWLYVRTQEAPLALYDLRRDPWELRNLAGEPDTAAVQTDLDARLGREMQRLGDDWGVEAHFPPPDFQTHAEGAVFHKQLLEQAIVEP